MGSGWGHGWPMALEHENGAVTMKTNANMKKPVTNNHVGVHADPVPIGHRYIGKYMHSYIEG